VRRSLLVYCVFAFEVSAIIEYNMFLALRYTDPSEVSNVNNVMLVNETSRHLFGVTRAECDCANSQQHLILSEFEAYGLWHHAL
jgi:hypothetical protein